MGPVISAESSGDTSIPRHWPSRLSHTEHQLTQGVCLYYNNTLSLFAGVHNLCKELINSCYIIVIALFLLLTLALMHAEELYCSRSVYMYLCTMCVSIYRHLFCHTVAVVDAKRGYLGRS